MAEGVALALIGVAPIDELETWLACARPKELAIYAHGPTLPADEPAVKLVAGWEKQGLVNLAQKRDPTRKQSFQYLMQRADVPFPADLLPGQDALRPQALGAQRAEARKLQRELLAMLRKAAERNRICPSLAEIADTLHLRVGERGRRQARTLLDRLRSEGKISIVPGASNRPRVVTILAKGRACGKSTQSKNEEQA